MDEPNLLTLATEGSARLELACDAIATDGAFVILLSVAGPQTAVSAVAAGLRSPGQMQFKPNLTRLYGYAGYSSSLGVRGVGYDIHKTAIGYDLWHMVAVARWQHLLVHDTSDALWQHLSSPQFTTPMLRSWIPEIERKLRERELLEKLRCFGCDAAQLHVKNETLDEIVSQAIRERRVSLCET